MWGIWKVDKQQGSSANILLLLIDNAGIGCVSSSFCWLPPTYLMIYVPKTSSFWTQFLERAFQPLRNTFADWRWADQRWQECCCRSSEGLEGWQTERLFQPTFCYSSLWQCPCLVWFWLHIFFLISEDVQQQCLMIYASKSWSHLKLIFGEGLPISWSEEVLWRMKVRRRMRMMTLKVSPIKTLSVWQGQICLTSFLGIWGVFPEYWCLPNIFPQTQHCVF